MTRKSAIYSICAIAFLLFSCPVIKAGEPVEIMAGEILVKFKEGTSDEQIKLFVQKYKLTEFGSDPTIQVHFYHSSVDDVTQKVSEITQEKIVKYAQANYVKKKNGIPNDLYYSQQWHLPHIGMPSAWDEFTGTQVIKVAVLDTGVNKALNDLASVIDSEWEYDFDNYDNNAEDVDGHGTLVSGIIGATANNSIGVAGISPNVKIVPLKADVANTTSVIRAMTRAYESGSKILNCSYGGYVNEPAEEEKISWLNVRGVLVVCSAGNAGTNNDIRRHYPCGYDLPNIISVANSTPSSVLSPSSNYGATTVDIAAPGTDIVSTLGIPYAHDDYRKIIRTWSFENGDEGWTQQKVLGFSFVWNMIKGGLYSNPVQYEQYASYSDVRLESPLVDCRNFVGTTLTTKLEGFIALDDQLGIYSGTSTFSSRVLSQILSGLIIGDYTYNITSIDGSFGRVWYWFTSVPPFNAYFGILEAKVTGIPIYGGYDGTSFSAPIVAGVAALLMSQNPSLTHLQVKDIILQTARKVSALNGKVVSGGIVDAAAALREAKVRVVVRPAITSTTSASGTLGSTFSYSITASGTPSSYNASGLPSGVSVNTSTGAISGTPTSAGTFSVSISASNSAGTGSATLTLTIAKGTPSITAAPTAAPITYGQSLSSSSLPGGSASVSGTFSFTTPSTTPSTGSSSHSVTFTPTSAANYNTATTTVSVTVNKATPAINTAPTASAITYGQTLASSTLNGGSASVAGNFSWTTPSTTPSVGTSALSVTFTPTDSVNYNTVTTSVSVTANQTPTPPPTGLVITSDLAAVSVNLGASFSHQITASGSPTSFGAIRLPTGLKLNAKTGLISGKPTSVGSFSATLQALKKGSTTATATKVFTVVQVPTFSYATRINAQRNKNVNVRPKVAGSPAPSFSVVSGSLPPGLSLNPSTAAITGTPTAAGSYPFTVRGSNSAGNTDRGTTIVVK